MELFVQRMRRPEKKEEVKKFSFEYTSRATLQGVAEMTQMTSVELPKSRGPEPLPLLAIA